MCGNHAMPLGRIAGGDETGPDRFSLGMPGSIVDTELAELCHGPFGRKNLLGKAKMLTDHISLIMHRRRGWKRES